MTKESKLSKTNKLYQSMVQAIGNNNTNMDISKYLPSIWDMLKEDCSTEVLEQIGNEINTTDSKDSADAVGYYCEKPYFTEPGYYDSEKVIVLDATNALKIDSYDWHVNSIDGDTISFYVDKLNAGDGIPLGNKKVSFKEYAESMCTVDKGNRDSISIRSLGIDSPEIPHFETIPLSKEEIKTCIETLTIDQLNSYNGSKNTVVRYMPFKINMKGDNKSKWTLSNRDKNEKVSVYVEKDNDKTVYREVILQGKVGENGQIDNSKIMKYMPSGSVIPTGYVGVVILSATGKAWGRETVLDGFVAQDRVREIIDRKRDQIKKILLILDNTTITPSKLTSKYTCYQSLWYAPETIDNMIERWLSASNVNSLTRLRHSPFGTDKYGRYLGAVYVLMNTSAGETWINLNKYVLAGSKFSIANPDFSSTVDDISGVSKNVFKLSTYKPSSTIFVDNISKAGEDSYERKIKLHKDLTGIDFKQNKDCYLMLGDTLFLVPPTNIRNINNIDYVKESVLRGSGSLTKNQGNREQVLEIDLYFYNEYGINGKPYNPNDYNEIPSKLATYSAGLNDEADVSVDLKYYMNGLRAIIAQFKVCPFLPIENEYINKTLGIEAVTMAAFNLTTVDGYPKLLKATLTLRQFNYRVYMPELPIPGLEVNYNDKTNAISEVKVKEYEPVFAKCINWELFRFNYQRQLLNGEILDLYEYNTYDWSCLLFEHNYNIQKANLSTDVLEFYVPDQVWLANAMQVKTSKDRYGQIVTDVTLNESQTDFMKNLSEFGSNINEILKTDNTSLSIELNNIFNKNSATLPISIDKFHESFSKTIKVGEYKIENVINENVFNGSKLDTKIELKNNGNEEAKEAILKSYNYITELGLCNSIKTFESFNPKDKTIVWTILIFIDKNGLSSSDIDKISENIRDLCGYDTNVDTILKLGFIPTTLTFSFKNKEYNYVSGSSNFVQYDEMSKIISGYTNYDSTTNATSVSKAAFDYSKYKEPENMRFIPYMQNSSGESIGIQLDAISMHLSNTFTEMYLKSQDGYAPQFMGGSDTVIECKITTTDQAVVNSLNALPQVSLEMARKYRKVMPCWPIRVRNNYLQLLGVHEVILDTVNISTIEGVPGAFDIRLRMTSVDRVMRQRESLRKLSNSSYTSKKATQSINSYFAMNKTLAQAEVYPDLNLPTREELAKYGWKYLKFINDDRVYVDPDFYMVYSYKYSSQLTKKIVKNILYDKLCNKEWYEKNYNQDMILADDKFMKMKVNLESVLGLSIKEQNKPANEYDEILEQIEELSASSAKTNVFFEDYDPKELEYLSSTSQTLLKMIYLGALSGWEIKPGWEAILADVYTNSAIEKLSCSGVNRGDAEKEDLNNQFATELYKKRKKAIKHIDSLLSKKLINTDYKATNSHKYITSSKGEIDSKQLITGISSAVRDIFIKNEDGLALLKLLDPIQYSYSVKNGETTFETLFVQDNEHHGSDNTIGTGVSDNITLDFDKPHILTYLIGFLFASACALSADEEFSNESSNWQPRVSISGTSIPYVRLKDLNGYNKLTKETTEDDFKTYEGLFGMYQIGTYEAQDIKNIMNPFSKVQYYDGKGDKATPYANMYQNSINTKKNRWCEKGFLDPYYNHAGYKSEAAKEYKLAVSYSIEAATEAFIRIMLQHLRRMIVDGYFFGPADILASNFDSIANEWNDKIKDLIKLADQAQVKDQPNDKQEFLDKLSSDLGVDIQAVDALLSGKEGRDGFAKSFTCRMIYPFLSAISDNQSDIMNLIRDRDFSALGTFTLSNAVGYTTNNGNNKNAIINKFLKALVGLGMLNGDDTENSKGSTVSSAQKILNDAMINAFTTLSADPRTYVLHSFYDMCVTNKRGRLLRAFPTYYLIFVDEGRQIGSWKIFDDFYNMSAISDLQVVKSRKIPADTCTFTMSNMYMSYTDTYDNSLYDQFVDVFSYKDTFLSFFSPKNYVDKLDAMKRRKELKDTTVLSVGTRVHVRMGYGADASALPIVFNGKVAEMETGEIIQVVCQGDGHELTNPLNALGDITARTLEEAESTITLFKDLRGSLARGGETPRNLCAKLMTAKYGGLIKTIVREVSDETYFGDNPFGLYHFGDRRFKDIFAESEVVQNMYEVSNTTLLSPTTSLITDKTTSVATPTINCTLQDKTMWDIMHMCANSGDGYYAAARDFGMRSTLCLCKANHYYAYEYRQDENGNIYEKRKPFQQFHYFDSCNDIVYNTIKATEQNMKTNAVGTWESSDYVWGNSQSTVGPIYLDFNIYPEYQKSMTVDTGLVAGGNGGLKINALTALSEKYETDSNSDKVNKSLAEKITTNVLRQSVKDMYDGELCIIGDSSIKPYDRFNITDIYEDMAGQMEVETVIFSMNSRTGFTTTIVPDCIVKSDDVEFETASRFITSNFLTAMGVSGVVRFAQMKMLESTGALMVSQLAGSSIIQTIGGMKVVGGLVSGSVDFAFLAASSGIIATAMACTVAAAGIFILTSNVKEMFYRLMKNIQALTVFPITKNQRLLVAGMAGHKGSVYGMTYGSDSTSGSTSGANDSIQGMILEFCDSSDGLLKSAISYMFKDEEYQRLFDRWRNSLGISKQDNDTLSEDQSKEYNKEAMIKEVLGAVSDEYSARAANIESLRSNPRVTSFNTNNRTTSTYLAYQIGGVSDLVENKNDAIESWQKVCTEEQKTALSKISAEHKSYIALTDIPSNDKIAGLTIVQQDIEILKAMQKSHDNVKKLSTAYEEYSTTVVISKESGDTKIPYIADSSLKSSGTIYDLPLLQDDAIYILKQILNDPALKNSTIELLSCTRVNDTRSWKSTGFAFTIDCDKRDSLVTAIKNVKKETTSYLSNTPTFVWRQFDSGVDITVYPPVK